MKINPEYWKAKAKRLEIEVAHLRGDHRRCGLECYMKPALKALPKFKGYESTWMEKHW